MTLPAGLPASLRAAVGREHVLTDPDQLRTYACDGLTGRRTSPAAVALPASTGEVQAVVRACHAASVPFVARGAGTGLSGGALPVAEGVVIGLARMRRVVAVDVEDERVTVEPGVTNLAVSEAVAAHGYFYAPDPSSQVVCTIGGNVAENSGGAHCLKHGFTTNHVCGLTLVLPDGELARLGGAVPDAPGYDLTGLVVGSEGTLGIVTEVVLRIVPSPAEVICLLAAFDSMEAAGGAVSAIVAAGLLPAAMEMMDRLTREAAEAAVAAGYPDCEALLLVELDGPAGECGAQAAQATALCGAAGATEVRTAADAAARAEAWKGRKAAFAAMGRISPNYYVQDGVVPRTRLGEVLGRIHELASEHGLRVGNVFHAGDGNLHPLVLYDAARPGEEDAAAQLAAAILDACIEAGGSITGEHGVGTDKQCHMPRMFDPPDLAVQDAVRSAFDPDGRCNPGKVFPTPRLCGEVPGPYRLHPLERDGVAARM